GVLLVVAEVLAHGAAGVRRQVLQRRRLRGRGADDDGVLHRAVLLERLHHLRDRRLLLADGDVDADDAFALLIDDGVDGDAGLAGLAVADDQLALAAADRDHGVDGLEARLQRLLDGLAVEPPGREALDGEELGGVDRPLAVDGLSEGVDHAADHGRADWHRHDAAGTPDLVALGDGLVLAEEHDADVVLLEREGQAGDVVRKLHELAGHAPLQAVDAGDAVADRHDGADLGYVVAFADA